MRSVVRFQFADQIKRFTSITGLTDNFNIGYIFKTIQKAPAGQ